MSWLKTTEEVDQVTTVNIVCPGVKQQKKLSRLQQLTLYVLA